VRWIIADLGALREIPRRNREFRAAENPSGTEETGKGRDPIGPSSAHL
jgi:hypothetical protein